MDNNVIFRAEIQGTISSSRLMIQFGEKGQDIQYNGKPVGLESYVWDEGLDQGTRATISLIDRTITRGTCKKMKSEYSLDTENTFTLRTTNKNNEYQCEYKGDPDTCKNLSTITLQNQAFKVGVRLEYFK